ncbi:hemopexin repeat-containing protein [Nocardia sp. NPDC052566]|uniref:hemopexin repeat-containing protein n=1 Tax=Nocardia sp. NPDC052566 TaxID=3364330 RepID=UPI0037C6053A
MHLEDRVDAALQGRGQFTGKAYLFQGDRYVRWDWRNDREDFGYPRNMTEWHPPGRLLSGFDAAVNGFGEFADKAYFFKGNRYDRYDWATDTFDLVDRDIALWRLPAEFLSGVDAVLDGQGRFRGRTYFFKGSKYVAYVWATDATEGIKDMSAWNLPADFGSGVDAAINGGGDFTNFAYFFKDGRYARYDWGADAPSPGYPHSIAGEWKHGVAVWAQIDTALNVGPDARLLEADNSTLSKLPYPLGTTRGQAGWDTGLTFGSSNSLRRQLVDEPLDVPNFVCGNLFQSCGPLQRGQVSRLAINAHGESGEVAINGAAVDRVRLTPITLATNTGLRNDLAAIRDALDPTAPVMLFGCLAGRNSPGTALLIALSVFFAGHRVVGFTTIGYSHGARQSRGGGFTNPGMRDTVHLFPAKSEAEESQRYDAIWNDLNALPWCSEFSPHAKVALNGFIISGPPDEF